MLIGFMRPGNLSQKMLKVIFSIYLVVTCLITCLQFYTEYLKTQSAIQNELKQLEQTLVDTVSSSLWQYNHKQLDTLVAGLMKMPIIVGVDIVDQNDFSVISKRAYSPSSVPFSIFNTSVNLHWTLHDKVIPLGTMTLYSSSGAVLDRILFGFLLIVLTAIIKLTILFGLFIWAINRYMAIPLKELMDQVDDVQSSDDISKRINLVHKGSHELSLLQKHINKMLVVMQKNRARLLKEEQARRNWLEAAVAERTKELQLSNEKLKELATRDSLTGLLNRGSFFDASQYLLELSKRNKTPACFVLIDLDYFKAINDEYGHFAGDSVLMNFAEKITGLLRKSDVVGRVGGEEFAVFLPETTLEDAFMLADKIRQHISNDAFQIDGVGIHYTVSLGVVTYTMEDQSINDVFKRADLKLYGAKDKGRDRVEK